MIRVDVTVDGGQTWHVANLDKQDEAMPPQHWAWTIWSAKLPVPKNAKKVSIILELFLNKTKTGLFNPITEKDEILHVGKTQQSFINKSFIPI